MEKLHVVFAARAVGTLPLLRVRNGYRMGASEQTRVTRTSIARRAARLLLAPLVIVVVIGAIGYYVQTNHNRTILQQGEAHAVSYRTPYLTSELELAASDLMVLSDCHELNDLLRAAQLDRPAAKAALAHEFFIFSANRRWYDQIRVLDDKGAEVVRVNFNDGYPSVVEKAALQQKQARYYFEHAFRLARGEVYVSPMDLNRERGEIERPLKPVIRLGTPVFDQHGAKRGILLVNYMAGPMLQGFVGLGGAGRSEWMLLNADGYWLESPDAQDEWGFMFADRQDRTFERAFPAEWSRISSNERGQFETRAGLFTFATVSPLPVGPKPDIRSNAPYTNWRSSIDINRYRWKVVSRVPAPILSAMRTTALHWTIAILGGLAVVLGATSWRLARAQVVREHADQTRHAVEERFRVASQCASDLIYDWNIATGELDWFGDIDGALGYEPGEFPRTLDGWFALIHSDDQAALEESMHRCRENAESINVEYRIRHKGGTWLHWQDRGTIVTDASGTPARLIGACDDITERRQSEVRRAWNTMADGVSNELLRVSLSASSQDELAAKALDVLLGVDFLQIGNQGAIFLVEDTPDVLVRRADRNLAEPLRELCERVPFGHCLCGRAASSGDVQFASCVDERHDTCFDRMTEHGHYSVPIMAGSRVLGVLTFHLPEGSEQRQREADLLKNAADIISGALQRLAAEQELKHRIHQVSESKHHLEILVSNTTEREKRMIELKQEVNDLLQEAGHELRYEAPREVAALTASTEAVRA